MALGQRLKQARLEAGLSQRQLCGEVITRNMLSQIENGAAQPSMATLQYLAARLDKTVSYFLEEDTVTSPNQALMARAREAFRAGETAQAVKLLQDYRGPDPMFQEEYGLLCVLCLTELAQTALEEGKAPFAARLLEQAGETEGLYTHLLQRRRTLLLAKTGTCSASTLEEALTDEDGALLVLAEAALEQGDAHRCCEVLRACADRKTPQWNLLMGDALFALGDHSLAAACYEKAEDTHPKKVLPKLEECYRELGDFRKAYEYACKQR